MKAKGQKVGGCSVLNESGQLHLLQHFGTLLFSVMQSQNLIRMFLFVVFFGVGATSLSGAILCDDLMRYFQNKRLLERARESLNRLESLNADYDALLGQLEKDPNFVKRIALAALGVEPADPNTIHPIATTEQLAAARKTLTEQLNPQPSNPIVPGWLSRCSEPRRRIGLFLAGAGLILVSFVCFVPSAEKCQEQG